MSDSLGEFEVLVLTAVIAAGQDAYGVTIHQEVEALVSSIRFVSFGAVYTTLGRLEEKGFLESWFGDATLQRGGRPKKFYGITAPGFRSLNAALEPMDRALRVIRQGAR
jgi:PadR family transcriptional regulator, regulatory protein PadR